MQDASLLTIQVSEVLKIDKADPIQVVQTEDTEYCMTSMLRRPPTVKRDVIPSWQSTLAMFARMLQYHRALGKLAPDFTNVMTSGMRCRSFLIFTRGNE